MPIKIETPTTIKSTGNKPEEIKEYKG